MLSDFVFSVEGMQFLQRFNKRFLCRFRYDELSGDLVFDAGENTYRIPESENVEAFKNLIFESIRAGRNLLEERYKLNSIKYERNTDY